MRQQQTAGWRQALMEVHTRVLQELGFLDLDPGGCWEPGDGRSFGKCCSLGDHAAECWSQDAPGGGEERRCCGAASSRRSGFTPQLVASVAAQLGSASPRRPRAQDLIPAVNAWLEAPTGRAADGKTLSSAVVDMLAEQIDAEVLTQNTQEQLDKPVERLSQDLSNLLKAAKPGMLPMSGGEPKPEGWLPLPTLISSGERRSVFVTIAITPQPQQVEPQQAEDTAGTVEEVALADLPGLQAPAEATSAGSQEQRALQRGATLLRGLHERTEEPVANGRRARPAAEAGVTKEEDDDSLGCSSDGWRELASEVAAKQVGFGDRVRIRQRMSDDVNGEEGVVKRILGVVGAPGEVSTVWEIRRSTAYGLLGEAPRPLQYLDLADPTLAVAVPCIPSDARNGTEGEDAGPGGVAPWPACIEANIASPSSSGSGLFVNLEALGIKDGCFQGDCSHSDHFACAAPTECARTCARIGACGWWTFEEAAPSTCWLRADDRHREELPGVVSGRAACVPPGNGTTVAEPTLIQLVAGSTGTPSPDLWEEWDIVGVLEDFGHMTVREVQHAIPSPRQRAALRAAALATSACADSWRGCA
eukprot:gnl/TRDRNA2_/TRDRNA2_172758_c1_seq2.p1 gnl/TRDRNA2_/TRDRNA2_172758_c1~~gnl/TRDRNA2_/TRDRNA2_172758_c1_seq2.p1  ORF type:complete len:588 (+),score=129.66 gnl/TRDRNA2_/TRDRNA2_172758_c1_seq2:234-1997(+)